MSATPPIPPSSNSGQVILQGVTSGGGTSGATNIPPGILALPDGTMVRGNIVHTDAQSGLATLRTPKGDMTIKSELPLARGHEVVIRLNTGTSGLKARIISVDGLTPKELSSAHPRNAQNTEGVDDLLGLNTHNAAQTGGKPVGTAPPSLPPTPEIAELPVQDLVEISPLQTPVLRAALLTRSPELPQLLQLLPKNVFIAPERLELGATISLTVNTDSIELPQATAVGQPVTTTPNPAATPALPNTAPAPATAILNNNAALAVLNALPSEDTKENSATPPSTSPTQATIASPASPAGTARFITLPNGGYAPNPLLSAKSGYTVTLTDPLLGGNTPVATTAPSVPSSVLANTLIAPDTAPNIIPTSGSPTPVTAVNVPTTTTVTPTTIQSPMSALNIDSAPLVANNTLPTVNTPITAFPASAPLAAESLPPTPPISPTPNTPAAPQTLAQPITPPSLTSALPLPSHEASIGQGMLPAQVIGTEQSGETVLKTPFGTLKLDLILPNGQRLALPPETTLNLQLISLKNDAPTPNNALLGAASGNVATAASLTELSSQWSSLRDAVNILQQTHPLIAQNLLQNIIPQAGPKMAKDIMFFLLGLKTGDAEDWLDKKTVETLEQQNRGDLVRKLSSEFGTIKQLFVDSPNPNWQAVFIPVHCQGEWQQTRLFIKKEKSESAHNKDETAGTRFIMEVGLSRLGAMQFDGFVKKQAQSTQFDLVIRSAISLPSEDQRAIRDIFLSASELTGFKGGLNFQVGQPFPIQPLEEIIKSERNVIA